MVQVGELALFLLGPGRLRAPLVNICVSLATIAAPLRVCWDGGGWGRGDLATRSLVLVKGKPGLWQVSREKCIGYLWRADRRTVLHSNLAIYELLRCILFEPSIPLLKIHLTDNNCTKQQKYMWRAFTAALLEFEKYQQLFKEIDMYSCGKMAKV